MARRPCLSRKARRKVEAPTTARLTSKQAENSPSNPLPESERLQELPFTVLECECDCVYGGDRQDSPRQCFSRKVLRSKRRSKLIFARGSFVAQGFDGIELRRPHCRDQAADDAHDQHQ